MAGYMVVGLYDCPWFAKAGIIVDVLTKQDPSRKFTLEMKDRFEWQEFTEEAKRSRGWEIKNSPVIWEILIEVEGKGNLIGDIDDFCEYVNLVFGLVFHISTREIEEALCKNIALFGHKGHRRSVSGNATVLNVAFINTPLKVLEFVLTQLLSPYPITDPNTIFNVRIFDKKSPQKELQGLLMEINDMAAPGLLRVSTCFTSKQCFYDTHLVIMGEDFSQGIEESPQEWLTRIEWFIMKYAQDISDVCGQQCKILVGCNGPQCYIAEIFRKTIPFEKVQEGCIAAIGQHVVNRAKGKISRQADVSSGSISRLHAWGWPGMTGAWVEVKDAVVLDTCRSMEGPTNVFRPLSELAIHSNWIYNEFPTEYLEEQRKKLASSKKMYPDMNIAEAIVATLHIWFESSRISQDSKVTCPTNCQPLETLLVDPSPTISLPVISVGIPCKDNLGFPKGTFVVQPAMCFLERWIPIGKISDSTHQRIQKQLTKLWTIRQDLIYPEIRDYNQEMSKNFQVEEEYDE